MNKKVVFTSIVGDFDTLTQPMIVDESFDYICFVRKGQVKEKNKGIWKFREIPFQCKDNRIMSRYPKMLPHKVLADYEYSIWIDGNVTIKTNEIYEIINNKIEKKIIYSGLNHWGRDCAYEDAVGCIMSGKDSLKSILKTISFLKKEKFPKHWGLFENNVIFRQHLNSKVIEFDELWWETYMKYAKRDQLVHPYCFKVVGLHKDYLLPKDFCSRNHPAFQYIRHKNQKQEREIIGRIFDGICRRFKMLIVKLYSL